MSVLLLDNGYLALFLVSFSASTLLPLGSEWLLVALILKGFDPAVSVTVATAGNYLGACTTYWIGVYGGPFLIGRVLRIDETAESRARRFYARYGAWSLFFSWLPVIGDPLCLVAGLLGAGFCRFSLLVFAGKLARYASVALVLHASTG
jgi:membrane protein YqaA with SNARE-associated domain